MAPTDPASLPVPTTFEEAQERLAVSLPGYESRPQQVALAKAVEQSWQDGSILVGQAGTGTGKSLGTLIPAVLSGKRTVYATATKALQSQVVERDLPFLAEHLGKPFRFAMLQGLGNYFCHQQAVNNASSNPVILSNLQAVQADDDAHDRDRQFEFSGFRDDLPIEVDNVSWSRMTTNSDDCTRKKCPYFQVCRFHHAKDQAAAADVVVANHALVALDAKVCENSGGNATILGPMDHLILDEVHAFEQYVTNALTSSQSINSYRQFSAELHGMMQEPVFEESDAEATNALGMRLSAAADRFFGTYEFDRYETTLRVRHRQAVANSAPVEDMISALNGVIEILEDYQSESEDMPRDIKGRYNRMLKRSTNLRQGLTDFLFKTDGEIVRMFEKEVRGGQQVKVLKVIPVQVGDWCREWLWSRVTPTLISATVLVDGKANYIASQLGFRQELDAREVAVLDVGTPFDYEIQSRFYVPRHIPEPAAKTRAQWEPEAFSLTLELIKVSEGRALLLFTSRSGMEKAWEAIAHQVERLGYPCRKQGDLPNNHLARWFKEETNSVLFGLKSFFQGFDVQGESLSLLVLDKLPFPVPSDPIFEARSEYIEARGGRPFDELSIPMMALDMEQAMGRLIRTKRDRGVMAIMDPRVATKGYGTKIQRSVPARMVTDLNEIDTFFDAIKAGV